MFFSDKPIHVVPFTQHDEVVQAAIAAADIGRGMPNTEVGARCSPRSANSTARVFRQPHHPACFRWRRETGYVTRRLIQAGMTQNRIALNWFYLRSVNGADFTAPMPRARHAGDRAASFLQPSYALSGLSGGDAGRYRERGGRCRQAAEFSARLLEQIPAPGLQPHCLALLPHLLPAVAVVSRGANAELGMTRRRVHCYSARQRWGSGSSPHIRVWRSSTANGSTQASRARAAATWPPCRKRGSRTRTRSPRQEIRRCRKSLQD